MTIDWDGVELQAVCALAVEGANEGNTLCCLLLGTEASLWHCMLGRLTEREGARWLL